MSRIGKVPIVIPDGVEVEINGSNVTVKGKLGTLEQNFHNEVVIKKDDNDIVVERLSDQQFHRSLHGLTRTLINNMVMGVSNGFEKSLEIHGVGYKAIKKGNDVEVSAGYSHTVMISPPKGIVIDVPSQTNIVVKGIDKQKVGQLAAEIRAIRKPEPYKGKGIRYSGEYVKRKVGKVGK